jgi:hypothetical protein
LADAKVPSLRFGSSLSDERAAGRLQLSCQDHTDIFQNIVTLPRNDVVTQMHAESGKRLEDVDAMASINSASPSFMYISAPT